MITVNDNDIPDPDAPVVSISADPTTITEGEVATFTVNLDRVAPAGGLTISVCCDREWQLYNRFGTDNGGHCWRGDGPVR